MKLLLSLSSFSHPPPIPTFSFARLAFFLFPSTSRGKKVGRHRPAGSYRFWQESITRYRPGYHFISRRSLNPPPRITRFIARSSRFRLGLPFSPAREIAPRPFIRLSTVNIAFAAYARSFYGRVWRSCEAHRNSAVDGTGTMPDFYATNQRRAKQFK